MQRALDASDVLGILYSIVSHASAHVIGKRRVDRFCFSHLMPCPPQRIMLFVALLFASAVATVTPLQPSEWTGKRVLFLSAHPDDIEGYAGGFAAMLAAAQAELHYGIVTNGDKGCQAVFCANFTMEQIAVARETEAVAAAAVLGVPASQVTLLDYEDCFSMQATDESSMQIRDDLISLVRRVQPHTVLTLSPDPNFSLQPSQGWGDTGYHPDHVRVGLLATQAALWGSKVHRFRPALGLAWEVSQFYFFCFAGGTFPCTHFADITETLPVKIKAFWQHKSQYKNATAVAASLTMQASEVANQTQVANVKYAEMYRAYF